MLNRTWLALRRQMQLAALRIIFALHPRRRDLHLRWAELVALRARADAARPKRATALRLDPELLPDERRELLLAFFDYAFARRHVAQTTNPKVLFRLVPVDQVGESDGKMWVFPTRWHPADQPEKLIEKICDVEYDRPMLLTYTPFGPVIESMAHAMRRTSVWEVLRPWRSPRPGS